MHSLIRALWRYGGILVQPRATARALRPDEGARDGLWLGLLYLLGVGTLELLRGVATARATDTLGGLLVMVSALGRVLVVPIVVLVACETVLGRARGRHRGLMLVPLLLTVAVAHELRVHGLEIGGVGISGMVPEIVGGVLSIALALWVREAIEPHDPQEASR